MLRDNSVSETHRRSSEQPRWVQVSTNEPVYESKLEKKTATSRQRFPGCPKKPPIPPGYLGRNVPPERAPEVIYSVVNKSGEKRRDELENWLRGAARERSDMFSSGASDGDADGNRQWRSRENLSQGTRGVVGLVGPYRIQQDSIEEQQSNLEYTLEDEELVEEMVDSISEVNSRNQTVDLQRWRTTPQPNLNNDSEVFAPNDIPEEDDREKSKITDRKISDSNLRELVGVVKYGKEERAVDVPDGASAVSDDTLKTKADGNNEQHDKDSLNETGSTTGGTVDAGPGTSGGHHQNNNNNNNGNVRLERNGASESPGREATPRSHSPPPKSLVSRILARSRTPDDLLDQSEPFSQLWIVLSNVYGELVIVLTLALCLAEVMDTPVPLLSLQGIFLMYMYVGSIAVIIGIYIWVLVDSCGSMRSGSTGLRDAELGGTSLTRFGSLKRAHISRSRTAPTSFYIRVGALLFGLATLVFNGLEMAMHSMMQGAECLNDVIFVHPVLHGLFTFLQMHFLFVNSQVLVERFGLAARFGFTHLAATNIAVWARLVIWDSAQEWTYFVHIAQRGPLTGQSPLSLRRFPDSVTKLNREVTSDIQYERSHSVDWYQPISQEQISQVVALQECLNTNTLGQLWTSSMPFLYPFIVQFSLIAAAVTFVMGQNVGRSSRLLHKKFHSSMRDLPSTGRIGCDGSSKGLFLGILCMVAGIVVILIFLVVREDENFPAATLSWLTCGTLIGILTLSGLMTGSGLIQIRQMSIVTRAPAQLDSLLSNVALFGMQLYSVFTIVVCACSLVNLENGPEIDANIEDMRVRHIMLLSASVLQLLQCFAQSTLIAEASKRCCITRFQIMAKPGRQIITFLLFSNAVLWAFDTVVTQNWISQELQLRFFGVLAWGVISRIGLPLLIFYRFHSCVLLLEAWNKCYRTVRSDHPLN